MPRPHVLLAVLTSLTLALPASADFYSHRYVGVSVGDAGQGNFCPQASDRVQRFSFNGEPARLLNCGEGGETWKLYTGWRWSPYFAVEASLQQLASSDLDFEFRNARGEFLRLEDELETYLVNAYAVGHWPLYRGLSLFAKVGGGAWNMELSERQAGEFLFRFQQEDGTITEELVPVNGSSGATDNGFHYGYGAGISYRHHNNWTLRAEWETFSDIGSGELRGEFDVETASLGWSMHF
ncbi:MULTISPECIES: outer membrane beta-barrel protein [Microbulbifer]|uniref:outer membrane beta-barrel protein n=1 Tax=Microbulbifer TaxID=48073 RepID=UPI001E3D0BD6|nr:MULTISPECIES: outer membrane beta-barrel protein [Microbulbifer]UHQ56799.1 porin family protein [Microbulbifer sp. YPW16]